MRIEMNAAVALTVGTNVRRFLLAGLAVLILASCGGGGGDEPPSPNIGWIRIDETSAPPGNLGEGYVTLQGATFDRTTNVSWTNRTTGESGQASHGVVEFSDCSISFCLSEYVHFWSADIRVVMGDNLIQVTASDGAGDFGTKWITITREHDVNPPTIISKYPGYRATGIAPNSGITIDFSEAMDKSTITPATVSLEEYLSGNRVPATVSLVGNVAFLDPIGHLNESTIFLVTITTGVKDLAGNALASSHSWTFTTGVGATNGDWSCQLFPPGCSAGGAVDWQ